MVLVDQEGRIVFKGHPTQRNLEKDIDTLLAGSAITGPGVFTSGKVARP